MFFELCHLWKVILLINYYFTGGFFMKRKFKLSISTILIFVVLLTNVLTVFPQGSGILNTSEVVVEGEVAEQVVEEVIETTIEETVESIEEPVSEEVSEETAEPTGEPVPKEVSEETVESIEEPVPEEVSEETAEPTGEPVPKEVSEETAESIGEPMPEEVSEEISEPTEESMSQQEFLIMEHKELSSTEIKNNLTLNEDTEFEHIYIYI
jgi:hypothetical protein